MEVGEPPTMAYTGRAYEVYNELRDQPNAWAGPVSRYSTHLSLVHTQEQDRSP